MLGGCSICDCEGMVVDHSNEIFVSVEREGREWRGLIVREGSLRWGYRGDLDKCVWGGV